MIFNKQVHLLAFAATATILTLLGCKDTPSLGAKRRSIQLSSRSWPLNADLPPKFTCDGQDISPELAWTSPPPRTRSLAVTFSDHYWLLGSYYHWIVFDLSPEMREIPEALPVQGQFPSGVRQGINDSGRLGYIGPCPSPGAKNHYIFQIYALDTKLNLPPGATQQQIERAIKGHVLDEAELVAPYGRPH